MEETGKPASKLSERRLFQRFLSWLFAVFAIAAAPLATGELVDIDESGGLRSSRELRTSEPPLSYLAPADTLALVESAESDRFGKKGLCSDCGDGTPSGFPGTPFAFDGTAVPSLPTADQIRRTPTAGFSSRAPPARG